MTYSNQQHLNERLLELCALEPDKMPRLREVKALLAGGAAMDARDAIGNTPLIEAVRHNKTALVRLLISAGASIDGQNHLGHSALMEGASRGLSEICVLLVAARTDRDLQDRYGDTALMAAIVSGHKGLCSLLLSRSSIDARNRRGRTALLRAALIDDIETCRILLENGAAIATDDWERSDYLRQMRRRIEDLSSHESLAKGNIFRRSTELKDEILFGAADSVLWDGFRGKLSLLWKLSDEDWSSVPRPIRDLLSLPRFYEKRSRYLARGVASRQTTSADKIDAKREYPS